MARSERRQHHQWDREAKVSREGSLCLQRSQKEGQYATGYILLQVQWPKLNPAFGCFIPMPKVHFNVF